MKLSKKNLLMRNFPRLSPMREEIPWQKIPTVSKDLINIYSGIMTQALVIAQKRTEWQNDPSAEWQKAMVSHQCKVHHQKNGGTVQRHASVILATCMVMWLMARQHSRKDMSINLTHFGALVEYIRINAKDMSRGHQFGKRTLMGIFLGHVQRAARVGQVT